MTSERRTNGPDEEILMDEPKKPETEKVGPITIDYEHLDVAGLMDQVKAAAARTQVADARAERASASAPAAAPDGSGRASRPGAPAPEGPAGLKGKLKKIALKIMRPFFPSSASSGCPSIRTSGRRSAAFPRPTSASTASTGFSGSRRSPSRTSSSRAACARTKPSSGSTSSRSGSRTSTRAWNTFAFSTTSATTSSPS